MGYGMGVGVGLGLWLGEGLGEGDGLGEGLGLGGATTAGAANVAQRDPTRIASGSRAARVWAVLSRTVREIAPVADVAIRYEPMSVPALAHVPRRRETV
jgi:hypothetical protein